MRSAARGLATLTLSILSSGCPGRVALPPPPRGGGRPLVETLLARDQRLSTLKASATLRFHFPPGMPAGPARKTHALVLAARPDKARVDFLTPLGTLAASMVLSGGRFYLYQPLENTLLTGPLDSPELAERSLLPIPLSTVPSLLRGVVTLLPGDPVELPPLVSSSGGAAREALQVRESGRVVQEILFDGEGGYPLEDRHVDGEGGTSLVVRYLDYGAVETGSGPLAFPQRLEVRTPRPEGEVKLEVTLSGIEIDRPAPPDAFTLAPSPPPRVEELH